jgi:hypothetical protein
MKEVLDREDVPADERLKLHDQALFRYRNVLDDYRPKPGRSVPPQKTPDNEDLLEKEITESVPKMHRVKAALLLKKMKTSPDTSWNEKGELKYKGEIVQGSNVVDLVNDVLCKRKCFNPQSWETFGETLREANVPQDLISHEDHWRYISQTKRTQRSRKRQQSPSPIRPYSPKTPRRRRKEELGRLLKRRLIPRRGSCKHGVDLLRPFGSRQLWRIE